ncbi:hypothetical protein Henu3_gp12 [Mycobacterium phage Henu3]|uniref:Uncharacterized protein n=1 Tax=Mycobacterium phage Henu3 TaxID=2492961 RepID=A0A410T7G4_9CAUD|nr:hypothetical protein I5G68_gp10 [Mycobacterium phage Henu3]QAU04957.1 hypothetical protein Henu3_gp12 [Mycobacterium phage Henu3]
MMLCGRASTASWAATGSVALSTSTTPRRGLVRAGTASSSRATGSRRICAAGVAAAPRLAVRSRGRATPSARRPGPRRRRSRLLARRLWRRSGRRSTGRGRCREANSSVCSDARSAPSPRRGASVLTRLHERVDCPTYQPPPRDRRPECTTTRLTRKCFSPRNPSAAASSTPRATPSRPPVCPSNPTTEG